MLGAACARTSRIRLTSAVSVISWDDLFQHEIFGHQRFFLQLSVGTIPHRELMRAIELFGTDVAPVVRSELAPRAPAPSLTQPRSARATYGRSA